MNPVAASLNGLAKPAPPSSGPISPSGAPGVPGVPQGTIAPSVQQQAPSAFNTSGALNAIANYYQIPKQTAVGAAGIEGSKFNATTAYEGKLQEQSEFAKQQLDPSKYKIQQTQSGLQILDPVTGQSVDTNTFSDRTGSEGINMLVEAAQKSPNARDQQFASDYNNFNTFMNALQNPNPENKQIVNAYIKSNPKLANLKPQQAAQLFNSEYGDYLGLGQQGQTPTTPQFNPVLSQQDINYLLSRYIYTGSPAQTQIPGVDTSFGLGSSGGAASTPTLAPPKQ